MADQTSVIQIDWFPDKLQSNLEQQQRKWLLALAQLISNRFADEKLVFHCKSLRKLEIQLLDAKGQLVSAQYTTQYSRGHSPPTAMKWVMLNLETVPNWQGRKLIQLLTAILILLVNLRATLYSLHRNHVFIAADCAAPRSAHILEKLGFTHLKRQLFVSLESMRGLGDSAVPPKRLHFLDRWQECLAITCDRILGESAKEQVRALNTVWADMRQWCQTPGLLKHVLPV